MRTDRYKVTFSDRDGKVLHVAHINSDSEMKARTEAKELYKGSYAQMHVRKKNRMNNWV